MLLLVDLPEDVLMNLFRYLDGTSLSNLASTHGRFRSSAAQWIKSMTVPSVNRHVHEFLSSAEVSVHSLDLSNCYSEASTIESLIFGCRSIRDLNIVNCNLPFPKIRLLLRSLTELETLSFSFVGSPENYAAALIDGDDENEIQTPIRRLYIEVNTSWESLYFVPDVLSMCFALEHLHLHFIGCVDPLEPTEFETQALDELAWEKLRTVVVSACEYASLLIPVLLSYLFETRLTEIDLRRWKYLNLPCFIFENGKFNTYDPAAVQPGRENLLRNAYLVQFVSDDEEDMGFPWGPPRGLKIICDEPELAGIAARFFTAPVTWASDLTELDLVECLSELPNGANWLNLFVSSPALEAIAIPSSFFPSQAEDLEDYSQPKRRRGWRYDVLSFLTTVKLKRLLITDPGPLPDDSSDYDTPPVERSFRGIDRLLHLEELTMHLVTVTSSIFRSLANSNVRVARFQFMGASNLDGLKEFIERSVGLKYLKLEATELPLGSGLLWEALANGRSLKQICVGTNSGIEVDLTPIATYLPQIIDRISVLHIHADRAHNRNFLHYTLRTFMDLYLKRYPGREVNFESDSLVSPNRLVDPLIYPGRRLCHISNNIARIKPIGWDLS